MSFGIGVARHALGCGGYVWRRWLLLGRFSGKMFPLRARGVAVKEGGTREAIGWRNREGRGRERRMQDRIYISVPSFPHLQQNTLQISVHFCDWYYAQSLTPSDLPFLSSHPSHSPSFPSMSDFRQARHEGRTQR